MKMLNTRFFKVAIWALCLFQIGLLSAQQVNNSEDGLSDKMAQTLADNYKFNVVVIVLITIFLGVVIYINRLDKRITKLESQK